MAPDRRVLILVIERDPYVQALERALLEEWGFQAHFVPDGESALRAVRELGPALLVTDILVPRVDGLTVCRRIKADPETDHTRVLIFSQLLAERRALEAGADAFVRKPLDGKLFLSKVHDLLRTSLAVEGQDEHPG